MSLFICRFCGSERKSKKSLVGHETFCKNNPNNKKQNTEAARKKASEKIPCEWCNNMVSRTNINKHKKSCKLNPDFIKASTKICPVCNATFIGDKTTCSHSCSNTYFRHSREGGSKRASDQELLERNDYRRLCFRYHEKKCVVCDETNIVAVHHLNEDSSDHRPENLIPLCPTHHQYWHSGYKHLVYDIVLEYVSKWKENFGDEEAGSSAVFGRREPDFDIPHPDQSWYRLKSTQIDG